VHVAIETALCAGLASHPAKGDSCGVHATGQRCPVKSGQKHIVLQRQIRFPHSALFGKAPPPLEYVQHYQSSLLQVPGGPLLARSS